MFSSPSSWTSSAFVRSFVRSRLLHVRVRISFRGTPTTPFASFLPSSFVVSRRHSPPVSSIKLSLLRQSAAADATPQRKKLCGERFATDFCFLSSIAWLLDCLLPSSSYLLLAFITCSSSFVCNLVPWGIVEASATFGQSCTAWSSVNDECRPIRIVLHQQQGPPLAAAEDPVLQSAPWRSSPPRRWLRGRAPRVRWQKLYK